MLHVLSETGVPVRVAVIVVWVACLPRMVPTLALDRGIFVSVAERLLAGDVLYREVWDNKDPLFYYGVALGRLFSPYGDVVLEATWVLLASVAMLLLARSMGCDPSWSLFAGFAMTPLVLTGGLYLPGYSHLPGIAVTVLAIAAATRRRWDAAGGLLAVVLMLKLVMFPVAAVPVVTILVIGRDLRRITVVVVGFVVVLAAILVVVQLRGELAPYVDSLVLNVSYSQASLVDQRWGPLVGHLLRVVSGKSVTVVGCVLVIVALRARAALTSPIAGRRSALEPWACTIGTLVAAVAVLAVTGLWPQHNQILLVPALLAGLCAVAALHERFDLSVSGRQAVATAAIVVAGTVVLSGPAPVGYVRSALGAPALLADLGRVPPEAQALLAQHDTGSYARVGQNDDLGHAAGLGAWTLACPHFHQYPFDPETTLSAVVACLPRAEYVIVSASATPVAGRPAWNRYLRAVDAVLARSYTCGTSHGIRVCRRANTGDRTGPHSDRSAVAVPARPLLCDVVLFLLIRHLFWWLDRSVGRHES